MRILRLLPVLATTLFAVSALTATPAPAQAGTGAPGSYFIHTSALIGGTLSVDYGYPALSGAVGVLGISGGYGPSNHPALGPIWIDIFSPVYTAIVQFPDPTGNVHLEFAIPNDPFLFYLAPLYAHAFVAHPAIGPPGWSLTKTVAVTFDTADGWRPVGPMAETRSMHAAVSLSLGPADDETRVLIAGGGMGSIIVPVPTATTEIYNPMKRTFDPGPTMSLPRAKPVAVRLLDGRVLICGGATTGGVVTATCEIFDPATNTLTPTGSMNFPRVGHAATLLASGQVFVSGGLSNWQNADTQFIAALNTSQNTTEFYDPVSGTWAPAAPMIFKRTGHSQTLMPDGTILIIGGITGGGYGTFGGFGQVPVFTETCGFYNPLTNSYAATGFLSLRRAFHGVSLLPNGDVLVTGGCAAIGNYGAAAATTSCERLTNGVWSPVAPLPQSTCFHTQIASVFNGDAIIMGGFTGDLTSLASTAIAGRHNGTDYFSTLAIGVHTLIPLSAPLPRGNLTLTPLYDRRSYLLVGGSHTTSHFDTAAIIYER